MENEKQHNYKARFREIYYSSLLEQRKENESNRIKVAVISIGVTVAGIAGIAGTIIGKGIQPFSNLWLLSFIIVAMIIGYVPWLYLLYVVFRKLEIDVKVIDEKIATIGKDEEYEDTESKEEADKLGKKFRISLIIALIAIICMPIFLLISTSFTGEEQMKKDTATKEAVVDTTVEEKVTTHKVIVTTDNPKDPLLEKSYGGKLPGFFETNPTGSTETQGEGQQDTTSQDTTSQDTTSQDTGSGNEGQDTKQGTNTEQNQ